MAALIVYWKIGFYQSKMCTWNFFLNLLRLPKTKHSEVQQYNRI